MSKRNTLFLIGGILIAFGIFFFFKSVRLYSFGFYRIGPVSTGAILIGLVLLDVVLLIATKHKAAKIALPVLVALLVLSVILGTNLSFVGSLLDLLLMLIPAAVGAGLILRAVFMKKDDTPESIV